MAPIRKQLFNALLICSAIGATAYAIGHKSAPAAPRQTFAQSAATQAADRYEIAHRSGSPMDSCVQAGVVAAAFLEAADEPRYRAWKDTERTDCQRAGITK